MKSPTDNPSLDALRQRAEAALESTPHGLERAADSIAEADDLAHMLHDLEVQRTELEMQNEELRRAQLELAESRNRYYDLYDLAPIGHLTLDRSGRITETNLAAARLLGVERRHLMGRRLASFMHEQHADVLHRHLLDLYSSAAKQSCALDLEPEGPGAGRTVPVHIDSIALANEAGERVECRSVVIDLTELQRAREGLLASELRHARLLESLPVGVFVFDHELRCRTVNAMGMRMLQRHPPDDPIGQLATNLLPGSARTSWLAAIESLLSGGKPAVGVDLIAYPDGEQRWYETRYLRVPEGVCMLVTDVTERKRAEDERAKLAAELQRAHKLEAIGTLASGVAHDFNNLLMGIGGCANVALSTLAPESPARIYVDEIRRAVDTGAAVARQLLAFRSQQDPDATVVELDSVVSGTGTMLRSLLGEGIELDLQTDAAAGRVRSRPEQIEQILTNLALNARDAMPAGGTLAVSTDATAFAGNNEHGLPAGEYLRLAISDDGCGMAEDVRRRAFEPFFTTKAGGKGIGLGLSMVYGFVTGAGGHIDVTSRPGQGATFTLWLPSTRDAITGVADELPGTAGGPRGTETILLLEDDPAVRMATRFYLEQGGYRVLEAHDGDDAIACCNNFKGDIDLLLSDVVLPGISGPEAARTIQRLRPAIAVLYMSAHPLSTLVTERRIDSGAPMVQKPFTPERILARVSELLAPARAKALSAGGAAGPS